MRYTVLAVVAVMSCAMPAAAQNVVLPPPSPQEVNLSGPRFGITALSDGVIKDIAERRGINVPPMICTANSRRGRRPR